MVTSLPNETELVIQAVSDSLAFAELFDHYFPRVYNYVRCRVGNSDVADDLTSHIFERIYSRLDTYRPEYGCFGPWIFSIAQHAVTDYYRKQNRSVVSIELVDGLACTETDVGEAVALNETRNNLLKALACLGERDRNIVALKFWGRLSNRRIAELTGLSGSNVGVILYRAMRRLRAILYSQGVKHYE